MTVVIESEVSETYSANLWPLNVDFGSSNLRFIVVSTPSVWNYLSVIGMDLPQKVKKNNPKSISYNFQSPKLVLVWKEHIFKNKIYCDFWPIFLLFTMFNPVYSVAACLYIRTLWWNLNFLRYFLLPQWC